LAEPACFFSYAHADDDQGGAELGLLHRMLTEELSVQSGRDVPVFRDRDDLAWGQEWEERIYRALDTASVLVPIVSPSYLVSEQCVEELRWFLNRERRLLTSGLILPIYWIDIGSFNPVDHGAVGDVVAALASRQYADWRALRFDVAQHRLQVAALARWILTAVAEVDGLDDGDLDEDNLRLVGSELDRELVGLHDELRELARGRGLRSANLGTRTGPLLRHYAQLDTPDSHDLEGRLVPWLTDQMAALPDDLPLVAAVALGLERRAGQRLLTERLSWLAEASDRDPRTVRRRAQAAFRMLAEGVIAAGRNIPPVPSQGTAPVSTGQDVPIINAAASAPKRTDDLEVTAESLDAGDLGRPDGASLGGPIGVGLTKVEIAQLAAAYADVSQARALLSAIAFPVARLPESAPSITRFWERISEELAKGQSTELRDRLVVAAGSWPPNSSNFPDIDIEYGADFFVSCVETDRRWGEWIIWVLEQAGFRVEQSAWADPAGENFSGGARGSVTQAKHTIVVLSDAYARSRAATAEWQSAWRLDPDESAAKVLVVRVEDCDWPGSHRQLASLDLFSLPEDRARAALVRMAGRAVSRERVDVETATPLPVDRSSDAPPVGPAFPAQVNPPADVPPAEPSTDEIRVGDVGAPGGQAVGVNYGMLRQQWFSGPFRLLGQAAIPLDPLPGDLRLRDPLVPGDRVSRFRGRAELIGRIDAFIDRCVAQRRGGFLLVEAEAGMGKSAFATYLAFSRGWPAHFTRLADGRSPRAARRNLAAQLIAAWKLEDAAPGGVLPDGSDSSAWLAGRLSEAATRRDQEAPGSAVVLILDGLDEAPPSVVAGELPLGLPLGLPPGVVIIATARPGTIRIPSGVRVVERIDAESVGNRQDLFEYLTGISTSDPEIAFAIAAAELSAKTFCRALLEHAAGVWASALAVLDEVRDEARVPAFILGRALSTADAADSGRSQPVNDRSRSVFESVAESLGGEEPAVDLQIAAIRAEILRSKTSDDLAAIRAGLVELVERVDPDQRTRLRNEFAFVLDDGLFGSLQADDERRRWLLGTWAALAAGNDVPLDTPSEPVVPTNRASHEADRDGGLDASGDVSDVELAEDTAAGHLLRLLRRLFRVDEATGETVLEQLRGQTAGERFGHGLRIDAVAARSPSVRCHVMFFNQRRPVSLNDVAGALMTLEAMAPGLDQFVIVSARSEPADDLAANLAWANVSRRLPFAVQVWSPATGIGDLFALDSGVHQAIYGGQAASSAVVRDEEIARWADRLTSVDQFPESWRTYLVRDAAHCVSGEDRAHFRELQVDFVEPEAADERGTPLGATLDGVVQEWLADTGRRSRSLLVLADFGEGKSFFTYLLSRRLSVAALADPGSGWVPLRLALKELRTARTARELLEYRLADIGCSMADWSLLCDEHRTLVILDGFDEMSVQLDPDSLRENVQKLESCYDLFERSKVLITSRTQFFERRRDLESFLDAVGRPRIVRLTPTPRARRVEYLASYARSIGAEAKFQRLATLYDPIGVAAKPLFLGMIRETLHKLPDDRFNELVLYETYIDEALDRKIEYLKDVGRMVQHGELAANLRQLLERIATRLHVDEANAVDLRTLRLPDGELSSLLWRMSDAPGAPVAAGSAEDARARVGVRSLLRPAPGADDGHWLVEFFHRSMGEYFFARAVFQALCDGGVERLLAAVALRPEVMDFLRLLIEKADEAERKRIRLRLLAATRASLVDEEPTYLGGNAISLLYACWPALPNADWSGLNLDYADLAGADLRGVNLAGSSLRYVNLDNADLRDADLRDADLTGVRLEETAQVVALAQTPGADAVDACYSDGRLRRWRLALTGRLVAETLLTDLPINVRGLASSAAGDLVVLGSDRLDVYLATPTGFALASRVRPRGDLRALRGVGTTLRLSLERPGGHSLLAYEPETRSVTLAVATFGPSIGEFIDTSAAITLWNESKLTLIRNSGSRHQNAHILGLEASTFDLLPTGIGRSVILAVGNTDGTVAVWRLDPEQPEPAPELIWSQQPHQGAVTAVRFSGNRHLITGSNDRSMTLFALSGGTPVSTRRLELSLQCAGAQIDGLKGTAEHARLTQALK
jgi:hypothetical protein